MTTTRSPSLRPPLPRRPGLALLAASRPALAQDQPPTGNAVPRGGAGAVITQPDAPQHRRAPPAPTAPPGRLHHAQGAQLRASHLPAGGREGRHEGRVVLSLDIDKEGHVTRASVAEPAGHGFDEAALEAGKGLEFEPARKADGTPFAARIKYRYAFTLTPAAPPTPEQGPRGDQEVDVRALRPRARGGRQRAHRRRHRLRLPAAGSPPRRTHRRLHLQGARPPASTAWSVRAAGYATFAVEETLAPGEAIEVKYRLKPSEAARSRSTSRASAPRARSPSARSTPRRSPASPAPTATRSSRCRTCPAWRGRPAAARPAHRPRLRPAGHADLHRRHAGADHLPLRRPLLGRPDRGALQDRLLPRQLRHAVRPRPGRHRRRRPARPEEGAARPRPARSHRRPPPRGGAHPRRRRVDLPRGGAAQLRRRLARPGALEPPAPGATRGARLLRLPVHDREEADAEIQLPRGVLRIERRLQDSSSPALVQPARAGRAARPAPPRSSASSSATRATSAAATGSAWSPPSAGTRSASAIGSIFFNLDSRTLSGRAEYTAKLGRGMTLNAGSGHVRRLSPSSTRSSRRRPSRAAAQRPLLPRQQSSTSTRAAPSSSPAPTWRWRSRPTATPASSPACASTTSTSTSKYDFSPRVNARYDVQKEFPRTTLKGGVGVYHQQPQFQEVISPFGTPTVKSNRSIQYAVGVEQEFTRQLEASLEGFYKQLDSQVTAHRDHLRIDARHLQQRRHRLRRRRRAAASSTSPTGTSSAGSPTPSRAACAATGRALPEYLFQYDQPHILTVLGSYNFRNGWEFGARFRLVSGSLVTPNVCDVDLPALQRDPRQRPLQRRLRHLHGHPALGPLHRAPAPLPRARPPRRPHVEVQADGSSPAYLDVQNVYNQSNVEGLTYNFNYTARSYVAGLPILPSIGVRAEL